MESTARGRYETFLDDPDFTIDAEGGRFAALYLGDEADDPGVFPMEVGPDYRFPVHFHKSHYMSIILRGSLRVGRKWYHAGDIRMQEHGSVYGPEEAGPEGCFMLNIFKDRRGAVPSLLGAEDADPVEIPPHIQLSQIWDPGGRHPPLDLGDGHQPPTSQPPTSQPPTKRQPVPASGSL